MSHANIAVVGCGYWGKNLVRTFHELGSLRLVCDTSDKALQEMRSRYGVMTTDRVSNVLNDPLVRGVVIAAPAAQHYEMARRCILSGKDVYVEKPLALYVNEGRELVQLAAENDRILMVGHILEYHPAILKLKELIAEGELGRIKYIYSSRLNLGKVRTEENILWSFAPHDISAILCLLNESPDVVVSRAGSYLDARIPDATFTTCEFKSGVTAHIFVSWLHPFKEQKLAIVGGKRMAVFDDVEPERKLMLYSHRIHWRDRMPIAVKDEGQVIQLPKQEPLKLECEHFLRCMETREQPRTNGASGLRVLEVLDACQKSLHDRGRSIELNGNGAHYDAHPTAVIDSGCKIGNGTKIWHFSHVMPDAQVGENCNLGQNVVVSPGVKIGNEVKIQNNVSIYTGVELEDYVFCGPSMVFTNVINPRSHVNRKHEYRRTLVKQGASIGANATIVCGVTLGKYSFVGAGAVVTRDVPDHALMVGVPAEQIGWVCYCGTRLDVAGHRGACSICHREYSIDDRSCRELPRLQPVSLDIDTLAA